MSEIYIPIFILQVFSPASVIFAGIGILLSVCTLLISFMCAIVTPLSLRQLRIPGRAKTLLSTYSNALRCFSDVWRSI